MNLEAVLARLQWRAAQRERMAGVLRPSPFAFHQRTGPRMNKKDNRNATEPIYRFIGNDETGAAMCRYYCPRCELEFIRRKPCASHLAKCGVPKPERFKLELVQALCGAKDDSECMERIVAYEEQGIHAVCVSEADGSWTIWKAIRRKAAKP
jgi:hypothetical protein